MKTKGCMFIALIISGAAFGQQAAVKQSVKVDSKAQVNSSSASGKAEIKAASRVDGSAAHGGHFTNAAEGAINTGGNGRGALLTELNAAGDGALEHVSSNSSAAVEATLNTATEIEATSTQNLEKVNDRLIKTGAAAKGIGAGLNATVNNALKIKAAPLKINTRIVGGAGLGIF